MYFIGREMLLGSDPKRITYNSCLVGTVGKTVPATHKAVVATE